jgi:hypothetical protein
MRCACRSALRSVRVGALPRPRCGASWLCCAGAMIALMHPPVAGLKSLCGCLLPCGRPWSLCVGGGGRGGGAHSPLRTGGWCSCWVQARGCLAQLSMRVPVHGCRPLLRCSLSRAAFPPCRDPSACVVSSIGGRWPPDGSRLACVCTDVMWSGLVCVHSPCLSPGVFCGVVRARLQARARLTGLRRTATTQCGGCAHVSLLQCMCRTAGLPLA